MKTTNQLPDSHGADSYTHSHNVDSAADGGGSFLRHLWASIASTVILGIICCGIYPLLVWAVAQAVFPRQANGSLVKKDGSVAVKDQDVVGSSLIGQTFTLPGYFHPRPSAAGNGYDPTSSGGSNLGPLSDKLINGQTTSPTPPATQPAESLVYDGIRLRTIHYAVDNNIPFKLFHAVYQKNDDSSFTVERKEEVPLKTFEDAQGNLNDIALVDAFPHPTTSDEYSRTILIAGDFGTLIPGDAVTASGSGLDPHITPANAELQKARVAAARNVTLDQVEKIIQENTDGPNLGILGDPGVNVLMVNLALDAKYPLPAPPATAPAASMAVTTTQPASK